MGGIGRLPSHSVVYQPGKLTMADILAMMTVERSKPRRDMIWPLSMLADLELVSDESFKHWCEHGCDGVVFQGGVSDYDMVKCRALMLGVELVIARIWMGRIDGAVPGPPVKQK